VTLIRCGGLCCVVWFGITLATFLTRITAVSLCLSKLCPKYYWFLFSGHGVVRYLTNQLTEFHQNLFDDVVEGTDKLIKILKVEGSRSRSQRGYVFERDIAAGGGIYIDAWASKYHLVYISFIIQVKTILSTQTYRLLQVLQLP